MAAYKGLTVQQRVVLDQLLAGGTQREAAAAAGVAESTVSRWKHQDSNFIASLNAGRQSLFESGQAELLEVRRSAIHALGELVEDKSMGGWVRLKAIELALRFCERPSGETDPEELDRNRPWWSVLGRSGERPGSLSTVRARLSGERMKLLESSSDDKGSG